MNVQTDRISKARPARKVIVTCAVTGSIHTPTMSPHLPITARQIADASVEAAQAGAAIIHLHARDPDSGYPSADPEHFRPFLEDIAGRCDAVLNISTGGSSLMPLETRLAPARAAQPEMCSLNMGSMNFGTFPLADRYSDWQHNWEPELLLKTRDAIFKNSFADIEEILEMGVATGARFEFECYDLGHVETLGYYYRKGLVKGPIYLQFVLGVLGGAGATVDNLVHLKNTADRLLGDDYRFSVLAAGKQQLPLATVGAVMGGNVRVGLEDSLSLPGGALAPSNAAQVAAMRRILEELGLEVATAGETREMLALKGHDKVAF
ncbi:3-keto-5-aminohexanoate cleavage protein [Alteraurantiacibacter aestuarii]|uniref:3-keto-5-aminohexanoate cleavage protein n=1 Tax=Alteraurantiacibacter aestuarii TaxID=650004 RepID=A0A844ZLY3_9SPHN|nr:3-keto-5-aminohexanoate cleavage protein [Alteraurantiacibacter aestuarii]MXO88116.1 3-keto-5-aminohexanoate cleavage protein [Alteraurantiacibacter aestuarii]